MKKEELMKRIEHLRGQLIDRGLQEGLQSNNVLLLSQQLDQLIINFMQQGHRFKN
jgi:hypothetical protein